MHATGNSSVSLQYYAKVVLAKQGMFNPNERLIFPLIYMPLNDRPASLVSRSQIYNNSRTLPSPSEDPQSWTGQQSRQEVNGVASAGGFFNRNKSNTGKTAFVDYVALVPNPAMFDRHTPLMCYVKITVSPFTVDRGWRS